MKESSLQQHKELVADEPVVMRASEVPRLDRALL